MQSGNQHSEDDLTRRSLLQRFGAAGALGPIMMSTAVTQAEAQEEPIYSSTDLPKDFGDAKGEPGVVDFAPPFDMKDALENWYATLKITNNLVGAKTYVPMMSRTYILPQNKPAAPLFGHMGLWTWIIQKPDPEEFPDAKEGQLVQRALYTGRILHPWSYEPVDELENPVTGELVKTEKSLFGESYLMTPLGGGESLDRETFQDADQYTQDRIANGGLPNFRFNNQISIILAGIFQGEGSFQPRADSSIWSVDYDELMDPHNDLIKSEYNFTGIQRARGRKWLGLGEEDPTQMLWNVKGQKVHSVNDFPDNFKEWILNDYPDRV